MGAVLLGEGVNGWAWIIVALIAGALVGFFTVIFHTLLGIPAILSGILTQLILWSVNLKIMGQANTVVDTRGSYVIVTHLEAGQPIRRMFGFLPVIIDILYCLIGSPISCVIRPTAYTPNIKRSHSLTLSSTTRIALLTFTPLFPHT